MTPADMIYITFSKNICPFLNKEPDSKRLNLNDPEFKRGGDGYQTGKRIAGCMTNINFGDFQTCKKPDQANPRYLLNRLQTEGAAQILPDRGNPVGAA